MKNEHARRWKWDQLMQQLSPRSSETDDGHPSVAIVSPLEIPAAGLDAILQTIGWAVAGTWNQLDHALESEQLRQAGLLMMAWRLLPAAERNSVLRPLGGSYDGKIVVVLEPDDRFSTSEFISLDVEGLILSSATIAAMTECVNSVRCGRRWVDPGVRDLIAQSGTPTADHHGLSSRELEVARLAASGLSNKRIARVLSVSDGTVKMHMHHILAKLRLNSRMDLIRSFDDPIANEVKNATTGLRLVGN